MARTRSATTAIIPSLAEGLHVLLVDEDLQNLTEMQCFFENNTYKVTTEGSTAAALSMILGKECPYDIAIAEIAMPDIDGFMFLQQIRVQRSNFPVILMTANMKPGMEEKARDLGATMFLKKPVPQTVMVNIWENVPLQKLTTSERNGRISRFSSSRRNIHGDCGTKMIWSEELHREFHAIVAELGEEKAKPQEILKLMNNPNLTLAQISNYLQRMRAKAKKIGIPNSDQQKVDDVPRFFMQPPVLHSMSADEKNRLDWKAIAEEVGIPFDELEAFLPKDSHRLIWCLDDLPNFLW